VDAARPFVTDVVPYDDRGITYDVNFESGYSNFNTLRTCNFIFAYTLETYEKVCIIESDMVIMGSIDSVFNLNAPAVLTYYIGEKQLKSNDAIKNDPKDVIAKCKEMGRTNGGVMLIEPSMPMFERYRDKIQDVVKHTCKYPNETLFEYVNSSYFNMPIQYNLSHFLAKPHIIKKYGLSKDEILVFHFNETKFKHIDIIKNPVDETGINWLENSDPKYAIKRNAVIHYKDTVYDKHPEIKDIMLKLAELPKTPPPEDFLRVFGKDEFIRIHGKDEFIRIHGKEDYDQNYKNASSTKSSSYKKKKPKVKKTQKCKDDEEINPETGRCRKVCPPGTIRNEKGKCVKTAIKTQKVKKCKDDEEINPETGRCRKRCPEGKVRNEKGNCVNPKK
jgi:lipopolysaccharide biosynthesis glycosyltransferase